MSIATYLIDMYNIRLAKEKRVEEQVVQVGKLEMFYFGSFVSTQLFRTGSSLQSAIAVATTAAAAVRTIVGAT